MTDHEIGAVGCGCGWHPSCVDVRNAVSGNTEDVTYMPAEQFDELERTLDEPDEHYRCSARQTTGTAPGYPGDTGIHTCDDLPDHSAGAHLCACGFMWRGDHRETK